MPRKEAAAKQKAESSGEKQKPSYAVQKASGAYVRYRPMLWKKHLSQDELSQVFVTYNRYTHEGRPLVREELCGAIGIQFDREPPIVTQVNQMCDAFDDPKNPLREKFDLLTRKRQEDLLGTTHDQFIAYIKNDAEAGNRIKNLRGL